MLAVKTSPRECRRGTADTEAGSRWMQLIAHHAARAVSFPRGRPFRWTHSTRPGRRLLRRTDSDATATAVRPAHRTQGCRGVDGTVARGRSRPRRTPDSRRPAGAFPPSVGGVSQWASVQATSVTCTSGMLNKVSTRARYPPGSTQHDVAQPSSRAFDRSAVVTLDPEDLDVLLPQRHDTLHLNPRQLRRASSCYVALMASQLFHSR